jgi:16S rRNA (guanine527-N7)-methyltransferase
VQPFRPRLHERAREFGIELTPKVLDQFEVYFRLFVKWNERMNLTALPLGALDEAGFDRLFLEPLVAAGSIDAGTGGWIDVGSGGGSPAVPLKLIRPRWQLVLVEAKARKSAFLREVVRTLELANTEVITSRVEELPPAVFGRFDLATVRAVKFEDPLSQALRALLRGGGRLCAFSGGALPPDVQGLKAVESKPLKTASPAWIHVLERST